MWKKTNKKKTGYSLLNCCHFLSTNIKNKIKESQNNFFKSVTNTKN